MLNNVVLIGRLTADPELRTTKSGAYVTSFCVACSRNYKQNGEIKADFIDVVAWRKTAEFVCNYFKKGSLIIIEGSINTDVYQDKNGYKRKRVDIVAERVSFGERKNNSAGFKAADVQYEEPEKNDFSEIETTNEGDLPWI